LASEAAEQSIPCVLSGGEAMLYPDLVLDLAAAASGTGAPVAVSTNGYWATDPTVAAATVGRLKAAGVRTLLLSTDIYHLPYVPLERVNSAATAALEAGLRCEIAIPSPEHSPVSDYLVNLVRQAPGVSVKVHPIAKAGLAVNLDPSTFRKSIYDSPCPVAGQLVVMPDGFVYACCAASIHFGRDSALCAGNAATSSLAQLIDNFQAPLLRDIQLVGPLRAGLREHNRDPNFALQIKPEYTDICQQCRDVCQAHKLAKGKGVGG